MATRTSTAGWPCSIARAVDVLGDPWTLLVLREAFYGVRRFDELQANLGVGRAVLSRRLDGLVEEGLLERRRYQDRPPRHEYVLTPAGRDSWPVLATLLSWGERHRADPDGPPILLVDDRTGAPVTPVVVDAHTGAALDPRGVRVVPRSDAAREEAARRA